MSKVLVVADDITGADDIGLMYQKSGHETVVYPYSSWDHASFEYADKIVIDTDSRLISGEEAYSRVYNVVKKYSTDDISLFFDKQCSVFRGNIGAEFDAMLDALGENHASVVLGFPDNGRTTLEGIHYVNGVRLEDSQFRFDTMNPMTQSNLVKILSAQTKRRVTLISYHDYLKGDDHLKNIFEKEKENGGYIIFDVRDNNDLKLLASLLRTEKVICGSSAIAYYLGILEAGDVSYAEAQAVPKGKVLCIAGSQTPQTKAQVSRAAKNGAYAIELDTVSLFDPEKREALVSSVLRSYESVYEKSNMVIIHVPFNPAKVILSKKIAYTQGIDESSSAKAVSATLAHLASEICDMHGDVGVIVCGGDTSASFINEFAIKGMYIGKEIESGVPVCIDIANRSFRFVLKSGSFGSDDFLMKAAVFLGE